LSASGCKQQAYNELYREQMAAEIRALEDRVYEFDSEYRALEQDLLAAEEELQQLRSTGSSSSRLQSPKKSPPYSDSPSIDFRPPTVIVPKTDSIPNADSGNSGDLSPPPVSSSPQTKNSTFAPHQDSDVVDDKPLVDEELPRAKKPNSNIPKSLLEPPNVEFDPPLAKPKPASHTRNPKPPSTDGDAIRLGQIIVPEIGMVQPASHQAKQTKSPEKIEDRKIVEIAFHASLCRGNNLDEDSGDDGIYLVLQPKNANGEFVPRPADLTIVAVDPNLQGEEAKIARWSISRSDAASNMQPAGISQGIHLSLPFQEKKPTGDRVIVYVRYELPNGLRAVNEHQIFVSQKGKRSLWTPRVSRNMSSEPK